VLHYAA